MKIFIRNFDCLSFMKPILKTALLLNSLREYRNEIYMVETLLLITMIVQETHGCDG